MIFISHKYDWYFIIKYLFFFYCVRYFLFVFWHEMQQRSLAGIKPGAFPLCGMCSNHSAIGVLHQIIFSKYEYIRTATNV